MEHSFNVVIASKYGIEEAIVVQNLYYWIQKNACNGQHFHDGRWWAYNRTSAFGELFPYMSKDKIYRVLTGLEKKGVIMSGNYSDDKFSRTKWYAFTDVALGELYALGYPMLQNAEIDVAKMQLRCCKNAKWDSADEKQLQKVNEKKEGLDFSIVSPDMLDVVKDWLQYKREKGQSYKPSGFKSFYARLCKLSGGDPKIAQEIIEASKSNNYAGIFPLKKQNQRSELDYLPTGMILRGSQEEREEKIKSSKWW